MRGRRPIVLVAAALACLGLAPLLLQLSCAPETRKHLDPQDYTGRLVAPPLLRLAIHRGQIPVEIACDRECILIGEGLKDGYKAMEILPPVQVSVAGGHIVVGSDGVLSSELTVTPLSDAFVQVKGALYPGSIRIMVSEDGGLLVVNTVDVETYLAGVVPAEMPSRWPLEALKAQTVAARTYALERKKEHKDALYDLESTTMDQVYSGWQEDLGAGVKYALRETRGLVMLRESRLFTAYFSSTCGGHTLDAAGLMPAPDAAFIRGVPCDFCKRSPRYSWSFEIPRADLAARLKEMGYDFGEACQISAQRANEFATVEHIIVEYNGMIGELPVEDFMRACGRQNFYSRRFGISPTSSGIVVEGRGFGHGVGLCQYGARGMAEEGWEYDSILAYYYGDVELARIY